MLVCDIRPGNSYDYEPRDLTNVGGLLYFTANDGVRGFELWRSDGTSSGTSPLNDVNLRRLFGDADSNGTVNADDFAAFGNVFGGAGVAFDFDNNNTINASDFAEFGNRFGVTM